MKYIPRAEISTIKNILYPLRKKKDTIWDKKNLKDLKDLKMKISRLKEEKQKEEENKPEPFKSKKFRDIPSKFKNTEDWINKKQKIYLTDKGKNENIFISNASTNKHSHKNINNINKELNKSVSIKRLPKIMSKNKSLLPDNIAKKGPSTIDNISKEFKYSSSLNDIINNTANTDNSIMNYKNKDFEINKNNEKNQERENSSIFEKPMSNNEEIENLIKEYRNKYGNTEVLESLIKEYEDVKKKRQANLMNDNIHNSDNNDNENKDSLENNYNSNNLNNRPDLNNNHYDEYENHEPIIQNNDDPYFPISSIEAPLILPKINKNYVKENIQLIVDKKIPQKKYINQEDIKVNKHKNYGKVPDYIKKYEMEREIERERQIRIKEEMKYPKGTKLLSEEERVKTLKSLIASQQEISLLLEKMPITNRTIIIQKRKDELIKKLTEIDKAIELFSKKKVFVRK